MRISTKNIALAIYESAKEKSGAELERALTNARDFLVKKNLISKSTEILEHLQKLADKDSGTVRAKILSSEKISDHKASEIKTSLKHRYKAEHIVLDIEENKSLLGGFRIETENEVIDLSTKSKLNQLKAHLLS